MEAAMLANARKIGSTGAIISTVGLLFSMLLAYIPIVTIAIGGPLTTAGIIAVVIALKRISEAVKQPEIYRFALYSAAATVAGMVAVVLLMLAWPPAYASVLGSPDPYTYAFTFPSYYLFGAIAVIGISAIFTIASAFLLKKSLDIVGDRLGIKTFKTSGLLLFLGAVLALVFVGVYISIAGYIILAVAFQTIRAENRWP
ncbi:MAG: DUF996 domain-containing protein [Candidatus Caldarchaeum sp.]|jgi:uncharacterized membrane protein